MRPHIHDYKPMIFSPQQELSDLLIKRLPAALITMDEAGIITSWNKEAELLFGYSSSFAIGRPFANTVLMPSYCQAYQKSLADLLNVEQKGHAQRYNMIGRKRNGEPFSIELTLTALRLNASLVLSAFIENISECHKAQQLLKREKEAAEATALAKSRFLANMSHEIRTPLNAIIGISELLSSTRVNPEQQEMVDIIYNSGETLLTLINDILDFSKIESKKLELEAAPFNLRECIEGALDFVAVNATEKGLELAYFLDRRLPEIMIGDVTRLRQVLVNFLSNAVKFTAAGEVVVEVRGHHIYHNSDHNRYQLNLAVIDTGIGIPAEHIEGLFDSFSQVDSSTTRKYGGTGLGLAISKRLVEMMGGQIGAQSTVGVGSTFYFTLVANAIAEQKKTDFETSHAILNDKRVLIVDDNQTNRRILSSQSQSWGMIPVAVASGAQALRLLMNESFDLAILDMQMPFMDGLTLAKKIRKLNQDGYATALDSDLPLIILTSLGLAKPIDGELTNGTYLSKPTKSMHLCEILMTLLAEPSQAGQIVRQSRTLPNPFDQQLASRHSLRILLAEDNIVNQKVALYLLQRLGYDAEIANNGLEVLTALQKNTYDVVLMDVEMPEMNGIEATQQIHSQISTQKRPHIIAMTAHALAGDRTRLIAAGMDDYISKPIRVEQLVSVLQRSPSAHVLTESSDNNSIIGAVSEAIEKMIGQVEPQIRKDLIQLFLDNTKQQISLLRQHLANRKELRHISHTLKGSSASLGLSSLSTLCHKLEEIAIENSSKANQISQKVTEIEIEYKRIERVLSVVG